MILTWRKCMAIITKIEPQKNSADKVNLFIDDSFYHGLYNDFVIKYSLQEGQEIDLNWLNDVIVESEKVLAFNKAMNYMGEAFKTQKQIYDYLKKKEYKNETIKYVIEKLKEYNYLNDEKYCEWYIRTHRNKYGKNMLKTKLYEKGISKNDIENALADFKSDQNEIIGLLQKKIGNKPITHELLSKTIRFMAGRGYSFDEIKSALDTFKTNGVVEDYDGWN